MIASYALLLGLVLVAGLSLRLVIDKNVLLEDQRGLVADALALQVILTVAAGAFGGGWTPLALLFAIAASLVARHIAKRASDPLTLGVGAATFSLLTIGIHFRLRLSGFEFHIDQLRWLVADIFALLLITWMHQRRSFAGLLTRPRVLVAAGVMTYMIASIVEFMEATQRLSIVLPWAGELVVAEIARGLVIVGLAIEVCDKRRSWRVIGRGAPIISVTGFVLFSVVGAVMLAALSGDFGGALLLALAVACAMSAGISRAWPFLMFLVAMTIGSVFLFTFSPRVAARWDLWRYPDSAAAPTQLSLAWSNLSDGGISGLGIGLGTPQRVPLHDSDFVLASLGNEMGLVGLIAIGLLACAVVVGLLAMAAKASDPVEGAVSAAAGIVIGTMSVVHVFGTAGLGPLTGVPFPFLSRNGMTVLVHTGLVFVSCALHARAEGPKRLSPSLPTMPGSAEILPSKQPKGRRNRDRAGWGALAWVMALALSLACVRMAWLTVLRRSDRPSISVWQPGERAIADRRGHVIATSEAGPRGPFRQMAEPASDASRLLVRLTDLNYSQLVARQDQGDLGTRDSVDPLKLTIDWDLQHAASRMIHGEQGTIVGVDAHTGEILALVSTVDTDSMRALAPGSIFKLVTYATAIEARSLGLDHRFPVEASYLGISNPSNLPCGGGLAEAIAQSCNSTAVRSGSAVDSRTFLEIAEESIQPSAGLTLGIEPSVIGSGAISDSASWPLTFIGQLDVRLDPMTVVRFIATIANDGIRPDLTLLRRPVESDRLLRVETAQAIAEGMMLSVEEGTSRGSAINLITTAAKTGTPDSGRGYTNAWAAGFVDLNGRRIAAAVVLIGDEAQSLEGARDAAPMLGQFLKMATDL